MPFGRANSCVRCGCVRRSGYVTAILRASYCVAFGSADVAAAALPHLRNIYKYAYEYYKSLSMYEQIIKWIEKHK